MLNSSCSIFNSPFSIHHSYFLIFNSQFSIFMTELYINGTAAVLPKDFSIQVKRENPLFTKNGEYTYDITLPLNNATNAELYKHLNRLNSTQPVSTDRQAVLVADNRVYCNGTEIITGWTEDTVSVQIASGNSELNWITGGDLTITSLTGMPETSAALILLNLEDAIVKTYPEMDFCIPPVKDEKNDILYNAVEVIYDAEQDKLKTQVSNYMPQPYLCAYIREVLKALGYTLVLNQIENTPFKTLYLCNVHSFKWCEMLPGWTVLDFLTELEQMFNVSFIIDNRKKTVRLMMNINYFSGSESMHITDVVDEYETEIEESNEWVDYANTRISYEFPDNDYWRLNALPDGFLEKADTVTVPDDYKPELSDPMRVTEYIREHAADNYSSLFHTSDPDKGMYIQIKRDEGSSGVYRNICLVDRFAPLNRGKEEKVNFRIVPPQLERWNFKDVSVPGSDGTNYQTSYASYIPIIEASSNNGTDNPAAETDEVMDRILTWADSEDPSAENINIAFYIGARVATLNANGKEYEYYHISSHIDEYDDAGIPTYGSTLDDLMLMNGISLRPLCLAQYFYEGQYDIAYNKAIKIQSYDPNLFDAFRIFEIRNKRYVCREMEFALDAHGRKGAWTGTFYPIKISDTEADIRWILNDGKWRDGGVWLDNGRWLDE